MLLPTITRTLAPDRDERMMLGASSFQFVQNINLKAECTDENVLTLRFAKQIKDMAACKHSYHDI